MKKNKKTIVARGTKVKDLTKLWAYKIKVPDLIKRYRLS